MITTWKQQLWLTLLLSALMGSALVPKGYMPTLDAGGHLTLVLCSGQTITAFSAPTDRPDTATDDCVFQGVQAALVNRPLSPEITAPAPQAFASQSHQAASAHFYRPLPRGPPEQV